MQIKKDNVVGMHYTLKDDAGQTLETSEGHDPVIYMQGAGNIIDGLEAALLGKRIGDKVDVTVEPKDGYGEHDDDLVQEVARSNFEGIDDLEVGMNFQAEPDNGPLPVRITAIEGDTVTVDGNHELAGIRLHFSVSIESVREATSEEIEHGHAHGPGGHHHH